MKEFRDAIEPVIIKIIEDWGLMMVDKVSEPKAVFHFEETFFLTTIHFRGPIEGHYRILCQDGYASNLAENLLSSQEATESDRVDALREMANVFAGNLLTETYGVDTVFDLGIAEVKHVGADEANVVLNNPRTFCYAADGEAVAVTFEMMT